MISLNILYIVVKEYKQICLNIKTISHRRSGSLKQYKNSQVIN